MVIGLTDSADGRGGSEIHREILTPMCDSVEAVISYAVVTDLPVPSQKHSLDPLSKDSKGKDGIPHL